MDLVGCEGAMELAIGRVDHFNHITFANTLHLMEIELDISLFDIVGPAGNGASGRFGGHDDYPSGSETGAMV